MDALNRLGQVFGQFFKIRNDNLFSLELNQFLALQFIQKSGNIDTCFIDQSGQLFHGDAQHFFALLLLAAEEKEAVELFIQCTDVALPQLLVSYLTAVAQEIQVVEAKNFMIVQFTENE